MKSRRERLLASFGPQVPEQPHLRTGRGIESGYGIPEEWAR